MPSLSPCAAAVAITMLASAGCTATASTYPVGYTEVYGAPIDYYGYPHTYYEGRDVYYYGDRWMYRDGGGWRAYTREPAELYRYRSTVRQAPPAPRYVPEYRNDPRYYPANPAPHGAPPGTRVR